MSPDEKTVAVFTASNEVGMRVARELRHKYRVKAVVRTDDDGERVNCLKEEGIEIVPMDTFDKDSILRVLNGCYGCFLATRTVFTEPNFQFNEIENGKMVVEQCKLAGIKHLVHLTHVTVEFSIGILARQNDAKEFIERTIRQLEIPATGLILPVPFEVILNQHKPIIKGPNYFHIPIPMGEVPFDAISLDNVGEIVVGIFNDGESAFGKDYAVSAGKLTVEDMARSMSAQLGPYSFRDAKITVNEMRKFGWAGCEDIANMYEFMSRMDLRHNVHLTNRLCPNTLDFEQWVCKHRNDIVNVLPK